MVTNSCDQKRHNPTKIVPRVTIPLVNIGIKSVKKILSPNLYFARNYNDI